MTPEERLSPGRAEDEPEREAIGDIELFGVHILHIFDADTNDPEFSYSVGLWHTHSHPEILIYGLKSDLRQSVINYINDEIELADRSAMAKVRKVFCPASLSTFRLFLSSSTRNTWDGRHGSTEAMTFPQSRCSGRTLQVSIHGMAWPMTTCAGYSRS
jgi:hypothetical protein